MLKVAVIGTGKMGSQHTRIYNELKGIDLIGVCDSNQERVKKVAKKYHTNWYTNYKEMLKKENIDAISIAVPTSLHKKVAVEVANAGINILIEKPIADTVENAKEIIKTCEKNNVKLMVGHIERFNPIIPVIKEAIQNNHIISINITRVGPFPPRIRDVGIVIDLAVHDIDLLRYLTNSEFRIIHGLISKNLSNYEDTAILSFEMENGTLAQITTNWLTPFKVREINISTREKFIRGWFIEQKVIEYSKYKEDGSYITKELPVSTSEPLKLELVSFIESIKENKKVPVTGYDGLKALEAAIRCYRKS